VLRREFDRTECMATSITLKRINLLVFVMETLLCVRQRLIYMNFMLTAGASVWCFVKLFLSFKMAQCV